MADSLFNLDEIERTDLEDLYGQLGIAATGTDPHTALGLESVTSFHGELKIAGFNPIEWLIRKGKEVFNRYWPAVRDTVCKFWKDSGDDWVKQAADAVAKLLGLPGAVVALIIKIAVKLGFDAVCGTDAKPQPAV